MKKSLIILLICMMFVLPLVSAQTYSGFDKFADNAKMVFSGGDKKVTLALEIREKEIDSAIENSKNQDEEAVIENLEGAHKKLKFVRGKVSLNVVDEVKESVDNVVDKIENEEELSNNFDVYVLEEKKTKLTAELTEEIFEYCKGLADEDFALMLEDEECNPETAQGMLGEELENLKELQKESFVQLMLEIRSCIDDPGTCNCEANVEVEQKAKCEKMVALAVRCEYKDDENACAELKSMEPVQGDGFAESFVPESLRNLFKEKSYMIDYNIEKSDVPEECWNENEREKPECAQYRGFKELSDKCWDKDGNFLLDECGGPENREPTMQESIPQCYDENDVFLEEKCGKVTMIRNEEGLVNYIIEKEIEGIIDEFENKSTQNQIDFNGSLGQAIWEVKEDIIEVDVEIKDWVVDNPPMDVDGDGGLTWQIKTDNVVGGGANVVVDNDVVDDGPGEPGVIDNDNGMAQSTINTDTNVEPVTNQIDGDDVTNVIDGDVLDDNDASDDINSEESSESGGSSITGGAIGTSDSNGFLTRFFDFIF